MLGVWVVSKSGKGKEIYIFYYFGMFADYIRDFEVFFLFAWCLGAEKMWESKGKLAFFFFGL